MRIAFQWPPAGVRRCAECFPPSRWHGRCGPAYTNTALAETWAASSGSEAAGCLRPKARSCSQGVKPLTATKESSELFVASVTPQTGLTGVSELGAFVCLPRVQSIAKGGCSGQLSGFRFVRSACKTVALEESPDFGNPRSSPLSRSLER